MERSLKEIIKNVGKEYELDDNVINDVIKKLQKEFYVKLKDMKNLSIDTWRALGLPINLYYVLYELYQSALNQQQTTQPQTQFRPQPLSQNQYQYQYQQKPKNTINTINEYPSQVKTQYRPQLQQQQKQYSNYNNYNYNNYNNFNNLNNNNNSNNYNNYNNYNNNYNNYNNYNNSQSLNNVKNVINNQNNLSNVVYNDLSILFSEINNMDISRRVFKLIYTIINNIAHNPTEEKYKRFNIRRFISKFKYKSIPQFFMHIGFKAMDEYMYLIGDAKNITVIMSQLNKFIKDNKIAQSTFDPYRGSISSLSVNQEKLKRVQTTEVNFEDLYYKEIDRRNIIIKSSIIERNPKFYELEKNIAISRIINTINQNDDNLISNSNEDKMIIKKNLALLKEKENDRFTLKSRTRLEQLMKTPIYVKSDIRLKFPNDCMLEGSFALYETIGDIYKFVKEFLRNKNNKFNISTTPPLKRYLKLGNTIQEEKLYPNILMYVNFDEQFNGLDGNKTQYIKRNLELMDLTEEEQNFIGGGVNLVGQYNYNYNY